MVTKTTDTKYYGWKLPINEILHDENVLSMLLIKASEPHQDHSRKGVKTKVEARILYYCFLLLPEIKHGGQSPSTAGNTSDSLQFLFNPSDSELFSCDAAAK